MSIREIKSKLPNEIMDMLYELYSPIEVDEILRSYKDGRRTTLRINTLKNSMGQVLQELRKRGIKFSNCSFIKDALIVGDYRESDISKLPSYKEGRIYLQNLSSMLPPMFLDIEENMDILDMCASPGSKTTQMAALINNKGIIVANEINPIRRERLKYNVDKQGAKCVQVIGEDGKKLGGIFKERFHRVLLDAPCSGEGTIYIKKPESYRKWNKRTMMKNSKLQKRLLESGVNALKKGGILVYSTCTLSPEENEEVINEIMYRYTNLRIMEMNFKLKNSSMGITSYKNKVYHPSLSNALRVLPNKDMEGFFVCKIRKNRD
ncbi:RsmB/NOP family class I SAM-dependent RNA methyltransferase [Clostridium lundense]|uniref:RsmB/NOP family class I SAM-dependent RNA methyltransferase n=1 Tax=Clostridium lundense TaxID=319475 RepID=UPI0004811BC1|nr:RsmB/NOP family class I SAM-dependent RNA methyltransferase [Clostridium lundense]